MLRKRGGVLVLTIVSILSIIFTFMIVHLTTKVLQDKPHLLKLMHYPYNVKGISNASDIISETLISKALADSRFQLTYMSADQHTGPIVERWPPNSDRTMSSYISETAYITEFSPCMKLSEVKLLIIVKSAAEYADRREINRLTWVKFTEGNPQILVLNVVANSIDEQVDNALNVEMNTFCDILKVNIHDHYMNNTLKMVSVLKLMVDQDKVDPDFILMTDDDSVVNVPLLWNILFEHKLLTRHSFDIWGSLFPGGTIMRPEPDDKSEFILPSVCPMYMFDGAIYPNFLSGSGYVLPVSTIPCLFQECMRMPFFHIDDVFITGMAAERCAFKRKQFPGFHPGLVSLEEVEATDVIIHWTDQKEKEELFHYFESVSLPNITNLR